MKYLVLGSSGQIGSALCEYLKGQNHEVIEFDYERSVYEDLRLPESTLLHRHMSDCDFIYFLAFDVGGSKYLKDYQFTKDFIDNNIAIMHHTFDMIDQHSKPFIFTSSQMSNMTYSPYGVLKRLGEFYTNAIGGINVKFWNVYGIEHDTNKAHVITDLIKKGLKYGHIELLTDGSEKRQMLHSRDCSRALYILSQRYNEIRSEINPKSYDITNFEWITIERIAEIISRKLDGIPVIRSSNKDTVQKEQYNEPSKDILNYWNPQISIEEGIDEMIKYYAKSHRK